METTRLSSKGQVIIPKSVRSHFNWEIGQELVVIETSEGILLRPIKPIEKTALEEVAGCLEYKGTPKTLEDMEEAIKKGASGFK